VAGDEPADLTVDPRPRRDEPLMPNVGFVARREYAALVRGRLFFVSTLVLAGLAMFVAILPVAAKLIDRGSTTTVAVIAPDVEVATADRIEHQRDRQRLRLRGRLGRTEAVAKVGDREIDAALIATRLPNGQLNFSFHLGETMGESQISNLSLGVFASAILDYAARNPVSGFVQPHIDVFRAVGGGGEARRSTRRRSRAG
jgi:hypothetical protein